MSYINDALRKVQKEKESRYAAYGNIVLAPAKKNNRSKKWLSIIGIVAVFFFAAGMGVFLYGPDDKKVPVQRISPPVAASTVVAEPKPDNKLKVEPTPQETTVQVVTKQEIGKSGETNETKKDIAKSKALFAQAMERQREGKLKTAQALYRKAIKFDPDNVQALNNLGVTHMSQKKYKRAIIRFEEAIKIKHDYPDAHYNLACLYAQKNDETRSLRYLKNAIRYNPEVIKWAKTDSDLQVLADLPAFKKLLERP
jgi:tetratricopeptide (TPR) repeat protein